MGRKKIEIKAIKDDRNRSVTFLKRKGGLFKKAHELSVLCSVDVAVFIFGSNKKLYEYSSSNMADLIHRYSYHGGPNEHKGPSDFNAGGEEEEDEDERETPPRADSMDAPMIHAQFQGHAHFPQMRHHTPSASPPVNNGMFPSHPAVRAHTPQPPQMGSRPSSRSDIRRSMPPNMAGQGGGPQGPAPVNGYPSYISQQQQQQPQPPQQQQPLYNPPPNQPNMPPNMAYHSIPQPSAPQYAQYPPTQPHPQMHDAPAYPTHGGQQQQQQPPPPPPQHPQHLPHPSLTQGSDSRHSHSPPRGPPPHGAPLMAQQHVQNARPHQVSPPQPPPPPPALPSSMVQSQGHALQAHQQQQQPPQKQEPPRPLSMSDAVYPPPGQESKPPAEVKQDAREELAKAAPVQDSVIRFPQRKQGSIFTPVEENRSILSQHLAAFRPDPVVKAEAPSSGRSRSMDGSTSSTQRSDLGSSPRPVVPTPSPAQVPPPPPVRTASISSPATESTPGGTRPGPPRPRLKVQIPDEPSEAGSATAATTTSPAAGVSAASGSVISQLARRLTDPQVGGNIVLPPPSPSASQALMSAGGALSAGASGPPNPFAAKPLAQPNNHNNSASNVNAETPLSALPSRFMNSELLPSPSSFYHDWNLRGADSNTLPSPLNFATPVVGSGPSFLREETTPHKRKSPDNGGGNAATNHENNSLEGSDRKRVKITS